ncbi:hypothetical protein SUVZ_13G0400 [Saccharomyces uvarum]|uniref:Uncharacterized protein n=1 Tax=Saccharomyces uvarum TaxID=230603 RepID=A0ABN8WPG6_SACUV|nr:hypothetical protein SUVZ_13G0400 [Saccharomyces uvarum]
MVKHGPQLEQSIGVSPAMSVASYLKMDQRSLDIESVFQRYKFENVDSPVHQFVRYPVVTNIHLENLAFVHRSVPNMNVSLTEVQKTVMSNERLEFLGDSWLGAFVAYILYRKYPFSDEGALSRIKNAIVNNNNLEKLSQKLGFKERLKENIPHSKMKIKDKSFKQYADCVEAYIGALVIDRFSAEFLDVVDWIEELSQGQFDTLGGTMEKKPLNKNAKGGLGNYLQSNKLGTKIKYFCLNNQSPFTSEVRLGDIFLGRGEGQNVKEAEQRAAMEAIDDIDTIQKYSIRDMEDRDSVWPYVEKTHETTGYNIGHTETRTSSIDSIHEPGFTKGPKPNKSCKGLVTGSLPSLHDTIPIKKTHKRIKEVKIAANYTSKYEDVDKEELMNEIMKRMETLLHPTVGDVLANMLQDHQCSTSCSTDISESESGTSFPSATASKSSRKVFSLAGSLPPIIEPDSTGVDKIASSKLYAYMNRFHITPKYTFEKLPSGSFHCVCTAGEFATKLGEGDAKRRKIAQHTAAAQALRSKVLVDIAHAQR